MEPAPGGDRAPFGGSVLRLEVERSRPCTGIRGVAAPRGSAARGALPAGV